MSASHIAPIAFHAANLAVVEEKVKAFLGDKLLTHTAKELYHQFTVDAADYKALATFVRNEPSLGFAYFIDTTAADYLKFPVRPSERFAVVTTVLSPSLGVKIQIKALVADDPAKIDSITDIYAGANWTEREVFDLYGIEFVGHPNLQRILMPEDYDGHPLRKDYPLRGRGERGNFPVYHAISGASGDRPANRPD
jgi:NADH-quinone oxidoreductase subunit C